MNQDFTRLDRFDGQNYSRWIDKAEFILVVLKLGCLGSRTSPILNDPHPISKEGKMIDPKEISDLKKRRALRREFEELCVGHKEFLV
ncbi:hypothetical protein OROGR_018283 [Orobanche gracilis]